MILPPSSRQPVRLAWSRERLLHERAIAIGSSLETSSITTYTSALQSYLSFCRLHDFLTDPTPDTLSFYVAFMCHHINPRSVSSYLSGICNQLEPFYPNIRDNRRHHLVSRTLQGCMKLRAIPTHRKRPLSRSDLAHTREKLANSSFYNDILFLAILHAGFYGLMRLGELVWPDNSKLQDFRKTMLRSKVTVSSDSFSVFLPGHKADRFFEGNMILITDRKALNIFKHYLSLRDTRFPFVSELWLLENGSVPTRRWFIHRLHSFFPSDIAGQSLRSGGATALAEDGVPHHIIQASGRWASEAFQIYIRKHPALLAAVLLGRQSS
jgi:hypothetical protein